MRAREKQNGVDENSASSLTVDNGQGEEFSRELRKFSSRSALALKTKGGGRRGERERERLGRQCCGDRKGVRSPSARGPGALGLYGRVLLSEVVREEKVFGCLTKTPDQSALREGRGIWEKPGKKTPGLPVAKIVLICTFLTGQ